MAFMPCMRTTLKPINILWWDSTLIRRMEFKDFQMYPAVQWHRQTPWYANKIKHRTSETPLLYLQYFKKKQHNLEKPFNVFDPSWKPQEKQYLDRCCTLWGSLSWQARNFVYRNWKVTKKNSKTEVRVKKDIWNNKIRNEKKVKRRGKQKFNWKKTSKSVWKVSMGVLMDIAAL